MKVPGATLPVLGIDSGGSGTRWLLTRGEVRLAEGRLGPLSHPPQSQAGVAAAAELLAEVCRRASATASPEALVAGFAGLDEGSQEAAALEAAVRAVLPLPEAVVRVVNDMRIAYRAAFDPQQGILLYAGTGSIACCELVDGRLIRAGGHGYLIDDAGGGFWIGRQALKSVLRRADQRGVLEGQLARELGQALGARDWPELRTAVYGGGRSVIASLVPAVGRAATAGDAQAVSIISDAGRELARLATTVMSRLGQRLPVVAAGGVTRLDSILVTPLQEALPPDCDVIVRQIEPAEAAARMARELARG